jgi:hypothetical protein
MRLSTLPLPLAGLTAALLAPPAAAGDVTPPVILAPFPGLEENPIRWVPHSAKLRVVTDEPTRVWLEFDDGVHPLRLELADPELATDHPRVPVIGMKHDIATSVRVVVRDAAGNETRWGSDLVYPAEALPANFPPLTVPVHFPELMDPGYTLFAARGGPRAWLIALDRDGDVVWFYHNPFTGGANVEKMRNGNLLWKMDRHAVEMDMLGKVLGRWYPGGQDGGARAHPDAAVVDADSFHHELVELPEQDEADFMALSAELRFYDDYPDDEIDPSITIDGAAVIGDQIVEFKRDGTVVRRISLLDVLDPRRVCYDTLSNKPQNVYGIVVRDWSHSNAIFIDPSDDTYLVSLRHQDCVVKIERKTGALVWILGAHERWVEPWSARLLTPVGSSFQWQFHQHAPELNRFGNIVLFDNGNYRAIPPAPGLPIEQSWSRAVEFRVDPLAMTVRQAWQFGSPVVGSADHFFSRFICDADPLPVTDNVLVTNGGGSEYGASATHVEIMEVTRDRPPVKVFEAAIRDPAGTLNWSVYRAERVPSLY